MSKEKAIIKNYNSYDLPIHYSSIECNLVRLTGRILTIIDGAIINERPNKAVKDQIRLELSELIYSFQKEASNGKAGHSVKSLLKE